MVKEKDPLRQSYAEMNQLRIEEKKNQLATEFTRYKQDCRKRALDLAHSETNTPGTGFLDAEAVMLRSDKYYNWLISIPEK